MKKYNILMVHNYYQIPGGEDSVFKNEKELLESNGHKVITYTRHNNEINKMNIFQKLLLVFITIFNFKTYFDIKKIIKQESIDIVHVHNTLPLISPSVFYAAKKMKVPVVQTIHNFRMLCPNGLLFRNNQICEKCIQKGLNCAIKYKCYRNSRLQTIINVLNMKIHRKLRIYKYLNFICLSNFSKKMLLKHGQISADRIYVKTNFFKNNNIELIPKNKRLNQFIYVGRLDESKGIKFLFETWKDANFDFDLIICGNGPLEKWCRNFIKDNNISNIKMLGFIENSETKRNMAMSIATIVPTLLYEGAFPLVAIDSFSVGTPIIGTNIGNIKEVVNNDCGLLFEINSKESMIEKILQIKQLDLVRQSFEKSIKYREENNIKELETIYNKVKG